MAMLDILGIPVSAIDGQSLLMEMLRREKLLVSFVNPASVAMARKDALYRSDLGRCDVVLCDGIGMVVATRSLRGVAVPRMSFDTTSLAVPVMKWAAETGVRVALVGGREGVAKRAARVMVDATPGLVVACCASGYGLDIPGLASELTREGIGLVLIGAGAPLQERLGVMLLDHGVSARMFTCGGYFDQLSGGLSYYPGWVDALNLRWIYRLMKEPRRLWRRYLFDYSTFIWLLVHERARMAKQVRNGD